MVERSSGTAGPADRLQRPADVGTAPQPAQRGTAQLSASWLHKAGMRGGTDCRGYEANAEHLSAVFR